MSSLALDAGRASAWRAEFVRWFAAVLVTAFVLLLSWRTPDGPRAGGA